MLARSPGRSARLAGWLGSRAARRRGVRSPGQVPRVSGSSWLREVSEADQGARSPVWPGQSGQWPELLRARPGYPSDRPLRFPRFDVSAAVVAQVADCEADVPGDWCGITVRDCLRPT